MSFSSSSKTMFSLGPPLALSQFLGLFPFKSGTLQPSRGFAGISGALITLMISGVVVNLTVSNTLNYDAVLLASFKILSLYPSITSLLLLVMSFTVKSKVSTAISHLLIVEHRFVRRKQNFPRSFFMRQVSLRTTVVGIQIYLTWIYLTEQPIQQFLIRAVGVSLTHFLQHVYELQFLSFVDVTTRWYALCRKRLTLKTAELLVDCHKELSKACRALENAYSNQNLFDFMEAFVICTMSVYYTEATVVNWLNPLPVQLTMRASMKFYQMFVMSTMVTKLYDQAKGFDESLYTLMLEDDSKFLLCNEKVVTHLSRKNEVIFTAGRAFTVHSTLMNSIASLVVNYLVILIQFGGTDHHIKGQH